MGAAAVTGVMTKTGHVGIWRNIVVDLAAKHALEKPKRLAALYSDFEVPANMYTKKSDREGQGRISQLLSWAGPRTVVVPRSTQGFGFTLRHFVVYPPEPASSSPLLQDGGVPLWQSSSGKGPEPLDTIFVKTVREGSTAHLAGLTAGDRIVAVNSEPVSGKSYADVISLIHSSHRSLKLLVVPKDEDILQMAFQSQSTDCLSDSISSLVDPSMTDMQDSNSSPLHKTAVQVAVSGLSSQRGTGQLRYTTQNPLRSPFSTVCGGDSRQDDARGRREEFGRSREDPVARRLSQSKDSPVRPMSQDSGLKLAGGVPSKAKYSFGLYFPPRHSPSPQSRATSADNLTHSIPVTTERRFRGDSDASSSSSQQDSGSVGSGREVEAQGRVGPTTSSPRQSSLQDYVQGVPEPRRDGRYYVPVLTQSGHTSDMPSHGGEYRTRSGGDRSQRSSLGSSVTMTAQSATDRAHRASLGSSLGRTRDCTDVGGSQGHTTFVVRIPVSGGSNPVPQHSYGSSFALTRSPRHTMIDVQRQSPSHPTQIEVQAGPSSKSTHIVEVQRQSPGPMESGGGGTNGNARSVWQRKVLFENGQNENNVPLGNKVPNRHRTELEKLTMQRRFTSVASRMASFEKSDDDGDETPGRENTPPTQPQPAVKVRRVSIERISDKDSVFLEAPGSDIFTNMAASDPYMKTERVGEVIDDSQPVNIPNSGPVRIYVSPSSRKVPSSPVVEIVPVCPDSKERYPPASASLHSSQVSTQPVQVVQPIVRESRSLPPESTMHHMRDAHSLPPESSGYHANTQRPLSEHEWSRGGDVDWQLHGQDMDYQASHVGLAEGSGNARPQRKSSYLSAVNAPATRYSQNPSPDPDEIEMLHHESPCLYLPQQLPSTSVMSSSDSAVNFSRPTLQTTPVLSALSTSTMEPLPSVVMRKKTADTVEDSMAKLHRRTSYLMATARDRSNNPSLEPSFSPYSLSIPEEPSVFTPVRQVSLNKLKNFFGEQTPSIVEATERCRGGEPQPESPLPDITREGQLWCKTAMSDGKKCSDRSWKQVWAVLRGHALFLIKDRRDGNSAPTFTFEEPPISIKSCLVDIAHDYNRKRKHVFRLTTYSESVYLLQAEDKGTMMSWIQAIKTNNNPDNDEEGIGSAELIRRKVSTQSEGNMLQTSPQTAHREKEKDKDKAKKLAGISFKAKLPHSPSVRRKKPEETSSKKGGWKGRIMPRSFKKQTAEEAALQGEAEDISKCTFGIPLEDCFPSPNNEYVPLIVELCTRIVEERGLEVVGVFRVPGNSVAVAHMQEELNKGIENMNVDNDKWLDVNVVSSLLKAFFRKLPQPLVTSDLYDSFIEANRNPNPEKRMLKLKRLLHELPDHHYETFKHLAEHLSVVAAHGHTNKMDAKNLAIMFGPTLIRKVEDDTASLVTDMSDQCRIVESIILHNDWFFSNWTQDHFVPIDSGEHTHPTTTDTRIVRDDDEDADSAINTKEIISSIVSAANKKLKLRQQNKSTDSLDFDTTLSQYSTDTITSTTATSTTTNSQRTIEIVDGNFQERSVDAAIARASGLVKSQTSLNPRSASEECLDRRTTAPLATSEPDFLDWDERLHYASRGRQMSEDTLLERSDEVVGGWVGRDTLDWLKRLEQEARTIRRLEEQRQRDMERRRRQQQIIERELQRSQRDLEMEDAQSIEDILAWSSSTPSSSSASGLSSRQHQLPHAAKSDLPLSREHSDSQRLVAVAPRSAGTHEHGGAGKYYVSVANSGDSFLRPASLETLIEGPHTAQFSHTGSLENIVDNPWKDIPQAGSGHSRHIRFHGQSGLGVRRGSLDSLLDTLNYEHHGAGGSTDSEDGSDLLTSLTTTFDQKLQILLNPKYRLTSRHGRQPPASSRYPVHHGGPEPTHSTPSETAMQGIDTSLDRGRGWEVGFRDPSLHRASKSDTKVGIASRFQRGTASSPSSSSSSAASSLTARQKPLPDFRSFLSRTSRQDGGGGGGGGSVMLTQPRKLNLGAGEVFTNSPGRSIPTRPGEAMQHSRSGQSLSTFRPFSKSEKMEVNTVLARLSHKDGTGVVKQSSDAGAGAERSLSRSSADQSAKASESADSSGPKAVSIASHSSPVFWIGTSPPVSQSEVSGDGARQGTRCSKRRHTVGGAGDLEHFKALLAVSGQQTDPRPSAWDQLYSQKDLSAAPPQHRSLQAWMQKERLRGSTPDLLNCGLAPHQFTS